MSAIQRRDDRLLIMKFLIYRCIRKISVPVFSKRHVTNGDVNEWSYPPDQRLASLPLTVRVVFILVRLDLFSEKEIAFILNISRLEVKERLARAAELLTVNPAIG